MDKLETRRKIGQKLRELRIKAGHSSYDGFAFTFELDRNTVLRAEQGKNITLDTLIDILNIHEITLSQFFEDLKG